MCSLVSVNTRKLSLIMGHDIPGTSLGSIPIISNVLIHPPPAPTPQDFLAADRESRSATIEKQLRLRLTGSTVGLQTRNIYHWFCGPLVFSALRPPPAAAGPKTRRY